MERRCAVADPAHFIVAEKPDFVTDRTLRFFAD